MDTEKGIRDSLGSVLYKAKPMFTLPIFGRVSEKCECRKEVAFHFLTGSGERGKYRNQLR